MSGESSADGAESPVSTGDLLLGRYRVTERLAEGGHSVIFRVEDERLRRPACAKIFQLQGAAPEIQEAVERRFIHEAFLLARLAHPGTVQIYDFGYLAGPGGAEPGRTERPFQICELVNGGPLSRWVKRRGRLAPREVLATVVPLCRALADVHAARLVHLDVKPQNILLARTATGPMPKLADFGIAQSMDAPVPGGESSLLMYSVNWAAPEQMVGDPVDATSDVYSLSLVTIYALTGRLVFQDQDPASAYRMRKFSDEVLGNALDGSGLGDELVNFFLRACSFDPGDRARATPPNSRASCRWRCRRCCRCPATPTPSPADDSGPGAYRRFGGPRSQPARPGGGGQPVAAVGRSSHTGHRRPPGRVPARSRPAADLEADNGARIRVSFVPSSAERPGLHIKGVNCFVASAGRRPSSALTLDAARARASCSRPRGERLAGADVSFATAGPSKTRGDAGRPVPGGPDATSARHLVALDFGAGRTCALVYEQTAHARCETTGRALIVQRSVRCIGERLWSLLRDCLLDKLLTWRITGLHPPRLVTGSGWQRRLRRTRRRLARGRRQADRRAAGRTRSQRAASIPCITRTRSYAFVARRRRAAHRARLGPLRQDVPRRGALGRIEDRLPPQDRHQDPAEGRLGRGPDALPAGEADPRARAGAPEHRRAAGLGRVGQPRASSRRRCATGSRTTS